MDCPQDPLPRLSTACAVPTTPHDLHDETKIQAPYIPQLSPISDSTEESTPASATRCQSMSRQGFSPSFSGPEKFERMNVRLASAFAIFFVLGWGDGVTGTLLPYFKIDFNLTFMTSSLCFVASTIGFWTGTLLVERFLNILGRMYISTSGTSPRRFPLAMWRRRPTGLAYGHSPTQARYIMVCIGTVLHPMFFVIMGCRRNFPTMLLAYVLSAFARSLLTATMNHYVASTPKKALGYMYGYWSIGSMCAPLVCQTIIATGIAWNHFYFGSLVLSGISASLAFLAFRPTSTELERDVNRAQCDAQSKTSSSATLTHEKQSEECASPTTLACEESVGLPELKDAPAPKKNLLRAIKMPIVWAFAIFCGIYTGTEADTQGFIVTYLLNVRNANPKTVGYCTSGFWGGLAVSRFVWGYFNTRLTYMQRKHIVQVCIALALSMQLTVWFIHSFVENAFATAFLGLAYGPIFVGNIAQANEIIPSDLHMIAMQIIVSCGSFGAALFPFITGTLLNYEGPRTLTYILVTQTTTLGILWFCFPSRH